MFTAILAIAGVLIAIAGIAYFIYNYWAQITAAWEWAQTAAAAVGQLLPDWLLPILVVFLLVTVLGIILKVI